MLIYKIIHSLISIKLPKGFYVRNASEVRHTRNTANIVNHKDVTTIRCSIRPNCDAFRNSFFFRTMNIWNNTISKSQEKAFHLLVCHFLCTNSTFHYRLIFPRSALLSSLYAKCLYKTWEFAIISFQLFVQPLKSNEEVIHAFLLRFLQGLKFLILWEKIDFLTLSIFGMKSFVDVCLTIGFFQLIFHMEKTIFKIWLILSFQLFGVLWWI